MRIGTRGRALEARDIAGGRPADGCGAGLSPRPITRSRAHPGGV